MPVFDEQSGDHQQQDTNRQNGPLVHESSHLTYFFLTAFISDSSITGAGPEIPPSFLMRQKCTAIKMDATSGMPMQCQIYERSNAFESTIDPPSRPKRTSL